MHPFAEVWQFVLETKREQEAKNRHTMRKVVRQHTPLVDAAAIFLQQMWRLKRLSRRLVVAAARNGEAKHRRWLQRVDRLIRDVRFGDTADLNPRKILEQLQVCGATPRAVGS